MKIGEFKVTDNALERVIGNRKHGEYDAEIVLTKDIFIQCYKKWIERDEKNR